nr:hypothetical protein [Desulfobulbaceae bacterium]
MFNKKMFAGMRRVGVGVAISKSKLSSAMLEILLQLPTGTTRLKETIVANMGIVGQMAATRDITVAWNETKKKAVKDYPNIFILDGRKVLHWNDGSRKILDTKISSVNFKKLNELADIEGCTVNQLMSKLISVYKKNVTAQ